MQVLPPGEGVDPPGTQEGHSAAPLSAGWQGQATTPAAWPMTFPAAVFPKAQAKGSPRAVPVGDCRKTT